MGSIQQYILERKRDRDYDHARSLERQGKYADAANAFMKQAETALVDNELIYSSDCTKAFEMWMKAGDVANAMEQARNALKGYSCGDWLKGENRYIDNLVKIVSEFHRADHHDEADIFLTEINAHLTSIGEEAITVSVWGKRHRFPPECPNCGGQIFYSGNQSETRCPFCKSVVAAINRDLEKAN